MKEWMWKRLIPDWRFPADPVKHDLENVPDKDIVLSDLVLRDVTLSSRDSR